MLCGWTCTCVVLGVLVLTPGSVEAGYGKTCSPERRREGPAARGMCGTHLSDALSIVCGGIFSVAKRSERKYSYSQHISIELIYSYAMQYKIRNVC